MSAVLEAFCCFCRPSWKLLAIFVSCLFAVFVGRLGSFSLFCWLSFRCCYRSSRKLYVGRLGSFMSAVLEAFCCFCRPSLFSCFLAILLAVLVACSSRSFLAKTFSGFPFLIGELVNPFSAQKRR